MSCGGSRVSIPNGLRKMIQDIREIAGKHSDDDIYAMLQECNLDPDETAQRLLYLDTFHEVKKKRDRRKVVVNNRVPEESRKTTAIQGHRARDGQGSSSYISYGAGIGKNASSRKQNGFVNRVERGAKRPLTVPEKTENKLNPNVTNLSNVLNNVPVGISDNGTSCESGMQVSTDIYPSASDPVVVAHSQIPGVGNIKHQLNDNRIGVETAASNLVGNKSSTSHDADRNIQTTFKDVISIKKVLEESTIVGNVKPVEPSQQLSLATSHGSFDVISTEDIASFQQLNGASKVVASAAENLEPEACSQLLNELNVSVLEEAGSKVDMKLEKSNIFGGHPVTFPDHLIVPEDFKNGLTFGSLNAAFDQSLGSMSDPDGREGSLPASQGLQGNDKAAEEPSLSNPAVSSIAGGADDLDNSQSMPDVHDMSSQLENSLSGSVPRQDQAKQEIMLPQGGPQYPFFYPSLNYGFPFFQPIPGSQLLHCVGPQPQSVSALVSSGSGSTTVTLPASVGQSPIAASAPTFPVFRQPYVPNFFPFGLYYPPFYLASSAQQLLGHSAFPQQPSASNVYLSPPIAYPGVKFSVTQGKPGISSGNTSQVGVPSVYGSYNPNPGAYTGSSASDENLTASELEEESVNRTVQQDEGLVWLPSTGQEISGLHTTSLYSHLPQGQHSSLSGIYHTAQSVASAHSLLKKPQDMSGSMEAV
ncbi:hypothetical protein NMG60_11002064 [Bertholletia excelsa]